MTTCELFYNIYYTEHLAAPGLLLKETQPCPAKIQCIRPRAAGHLRGRKAFPPHAGSAPLQHLHRSPGRTSTVCSQDGEGTSREEEFGIPDGHLSKREERTLHQEYQANIVYEVEAAQAERNNLKYQLEMYKNMLDTLYQETEKLISDHRMEILHLHQMLADQVEQTKTLVHLLNACIHGNLSSIWTNVITLPT
jgi:hypothetical protein